LRNDSFKVKTVTLNSGFVLTILIEIEPPSNNESPRKENRKNAKEYYKVGQRKVSFTLATA